MEPLHLAEGLDLPVEAVTETLAILARRGAGKTSTAAVLVEELLDDGLPVVVIDPTGAWWGLRSSADGKGDGYPVVIVGGEHADLPLQETSGALVADLVIEQRIPLVLDLSELSKAAMRRFTTDFLERLYLANREALHVVVDEADVIAPQRLPADMTRLFSAVDAVVRRGRKKGLGVTLISQRPAVINKDVLSQIEVLIVGQLTSKLDRKAIDDWVSEHGDAEEARELRASLPSLTAGEMWVWSPSWLNILSRVRIRRRRTFDSGATPKPGAARIEPTRWTKVDLGSLRERLAAPAAETATTAAGTTIVRLRNQVADLTSKLSAAQARPVEVRRVEVPVLGPDMGEHLRSLAKQMDILSIALNAVLERFGDDPAPVAPPVEPRPVAVAPSARRTTARRVAAPNGEGDAKLSRAERAILIVLAQHGRRTTTQVALLTGYSHKSGGYRNALSKLRTAGYIDGRGDIEATGDGLAALGEYEPLPAGPALLDWWYGQLPKAERSILAVVVAAWPAEVPVDVIAEATDYSASSGGFRNALSRLRSLELAAGRGALRAADVLGEAFQS